MSCIIKCKNCGGFNDPTEWPESERENFTPDMCYNCFRDQTRVEADDREDCPIETDDDPDGLRAIDDAEKEEEEEEDHED